MNINKHMIVADIIQSCMGALDIFDKYGMNCRICNGVYSETLETAARAHGIKIEAILYDLNHLESSVG